MCFACTLYLLVERQNLLQNPRNLCFISPSRPVAGGFDLEKTYTDNIWTLLITTTRKLNYSKPIMNFSIWFESLCLCKHLRNNIDVCVSVCVQHVYLSSVSGRCWTHSSLLLVDGWGYISGTRCVMLSSRCSINVLYCCCSSTTVGTLHIQINTQHLTNYTSHFTYTHSSIRLLSVYLRRSKLTA